MTAGPTCRSWSAGAAAVTLAAAAPLLLVTGSAPADVGSPRAVASASPAPVPTPVPPSVSPSVAPTPAPRTPPPSTSAPREDLAQAAVDAAEERAAGSTEPAVAVLDRRTGELAVNGRGDEPYYTASLSKLVVIVDVLDRRRLEGLTVTDADLALFRRARVERRRRDERVVGAVRRGGGSRAGEQAARADGDPHRAAPASGARSRSPPRISSGCGVTSWTTCRPTTAPC
jgi:hypothetical protein